MGLDDMNEGFLQVTNHKEHPTNKAYKIFFFYSKQESDHFANLLTENSIFFEQGKDQTKKGDIYESKAISEVFGEKTPPVTALKSYFGHTIGASGVNEIIAMIESAKRGIIIPTLNLTDIDKASQINHCLEVKHCNVRYILKNSFGFGGTNSSIILKINNSNLH